MLFNFISFFDEIPISNKQKSHRWDAAFNGVTSGAVLFTYVIKKNARLIWVNERVCNVCNMNKAEDEVHIFLIFP